MSVAESVVALGKSLFSIVIALLALAFVLGLGWYVLWKLVLQNYKFFRELVQSFTNPKKAPELARPQGARTVPTPQSAAVSAAATVTPRRSAGTVL